MDRFANHRTYTTGVVSPDSVGNLVDEVQLVHFDRHVRIEQLLDHLLSLVCVLGILSPPGGSCDC